MLDSILITDEEMEALPPGLSGFLAFEKLCQIRLAEIEEYRGENGDTLDARISYFNNVISAAEYFEIDSLTRLDFDPDVDFSYDKSRSIARLIQKEITRLRFMSLKDNKPVPYVDEPKRSKIEHLITQLRQRVEDSDIDDRKKEKLLKKIDELNKIFKKGGSANLQVTMLTIASFFTAINQAEAAIIKLPEVISVVLEAFGHAQEDADQRSLEVKVRKLIEHHNKESDDSNIDDDIPF